MAGKNERGRALLARVVAHLAGPDSPIGERQPLDAEAIGALEDQLGVALSPSLHALLSFDAGWAARRLGWREGERWAGRPALELVEAFAGPVFAAYEALFVRRFPGNALPLGPWDDDTMRLLYLGDPDALGEYPVIGLDHDDEPAVAVADAGFDVWLARELGLAGPRAFSAEREAASKRILGRRSEVYALDPPKRLPAPVAGPPPRSVVHQPLPPHAAPRPRRLTDAQLAKALAERAQEGNVARLDPLLADARERGLGREPLDDALCAAAHHDQPAAVLRLLDAGASPDARDRRGVALARAMWTRTDEIQDALLARGADPNGAGVLGATVLHHAVSRGRTSLVRKLLAAGADPGRRDHHRYTALARAVSASIPDPVPPVELVDLLIDAGADPSDPVVPPLLLAIEHAPEEHVLRLLARGADPKARRHGTPALHLAFARAREAVVAALLQAGADPTERDEAGVSLDGVVGPDAGPPVVIRPPEADGLLVVDLQILVIDPIHLDLLKPALRVEWWEQAGRAGLLGGAEVSGRALRLEGESEGVVERQLRWTVARASPTFARWMLAGMLHEPSPTPVCRVTGLTAAVAGVTADEVRRAAADPSALFARPAPPYPVRTHGPSSGVRIVAAGGAKDAKRAARLLEQRVETWLGCGAFWRPRRGEGAWMQGPAAQVAGAEVRLDLVDLAGRRGKPSPWPWEHAASLAALEQVLIGIHAEVPLAEVSYALPA